MKITLALLGLLAAATDAFGDWPLLCLSSPPMQLVAGTAYVSAT